MEDRKHKSIYASEILPSQSPRYVRKKRIPINQARKYHSQLSVQGKIFASKNVLSDKSNESDLSFYDKNFSLKESHLPSEVLNIRSEQYSKVTCNETLHPYVIQRTLKHSHSLPLINKEVVNRITKCKSCDLLCGCSTQGMESSKTQLSDEPVSSIFSANISEQPKNQFHDSDIFYDCFDGNIVADNVSRRSSTSTVRERNNSQDSAFSQISIIDIKEIEDEMRNIDEFDVIDNSSHFKPHHSRSKSDTSEIHVCENDESEVFSLPNSFTEKETRRKKSLFEGQQINVPTECFFPRPQQGQSLTSFLSSNEFNISAELDRENAHFCISDALISAIEHMKCAKSLRRIEEDDEDESDEEIRKLTQRIRIRRREKHREKVIKSIILLSDGKTDTTTSQSASPPVSSHSSDFEIDSLKSEDEVEDLELSAQTDSNLNSMKENGLSLSMASLYSEADIHKANLMHKETDNKKFLESDSVNLSAESVALSLLRKFSEKNLPKASELQWLVTEQEAPQRLLPLPDSWPISPDVIEEEYYLGNTRLRGNLEWAPPRPQIIFSVHPNMSRKAIIEKQKFRCAGCGMKIEKSYFKRFRYCDYFGKYFCQCCHSNNLAYIPGRILWKWNFTKYYVSKFAWNLLDHMFSDPLFNIEDINSNLYIKVRLLDQCRSYRMQLFYLKDFIKTCRKASILQLLLDKQNHHIVYEPHVYSISDLVQVKSGGLSKHLNQLVNHCIEHVKQCILCQAKGFICEICRKDSDIIFPFQFDKVILCQNCGSCFHKSCCKNIQCPRCVRIQERKKRLAEYKSDEEL